MSVEKTQQPIIRNKTKTVYCWIIGQTLCDLDTGELTRLKYDYPFFVGYTCIINDGFWRYVLKPRSDIKDFICGSIDNKIKNEENFR